VDEDNRSAAKAWEIARAILRYLETHPEAKDTLEGIAQWWLWLELPEQRLEDVERAVAVLASKGLILEARREGVPPYYRLNPKQHGAIARILSKSTVWVSR
jgi:hypothetical protein